MTDSLELREKKHS